MNPRRTSQGTFCPKYPSGHAGYPCKLGTQGPPARWVLGHLSLGPGTPYDRQYASVGSTGGSGLARHPAARRSGKETLGRGCQATVPLSHPFPRPTTYLRSIPHLRPEVHPANLAPLPSSPYVPVPTKRSSASPAGLCHCPKTIRSLPPPARPCLPLLPPAPAPSPPPVPAPLPPGPCSSPHSPPPAPRPPRPRPRVRPARPAAPGPRGPR